MICKKCFTYDLSRALIQVMMNKLSFFEKKKKKIELLRKRGDAADLVERASSEPAALNCSSPGAVIETIYRFLPC